MTYKCTIRRYALARKMAADRHKGGPYKLSEFGHIWLPAVEVYLYNDGFIKTKPEIKL